jgi:phosphomannomutase/phosphoglucomutase
MLSPAIFREYDIRGIADEQLANEDVEVLGQAMGTYLIRAAGAKISLGRDTRLSSPRLHEALRKGLVAAGAQVTDIGIVPTPLLYYSVYKLKLDGGIMITGSHNPAEFNGFKAMTSKESLHGKAIQKLREMIETGDLDSGAGSVTEVDVVTPYVDEIPRQFDWKRRIKVVFDAGNGVAGPVMHRLIEKLNIDAVELFFEMDGTFPNHHPDPTVEKNLAHLKKAVAEHQAELGIAFDGDSDRIGAVDEKGNVIWGDILMLIYGREILTRKPGATFIGEVKCSQVLYDELKRLGGNPIMYRTGHSLIKAKMKEEHAELAGEMSGHMFFADRYYGYDDALYAACRLMEIVANSGKPLSAQTEGLPKMYTTPEMRVDMPDDVKFDVVRRVVERFRKTHNVVDIDGVRVLFDKGWGLVRASNTQPALVMRFEAETPELLQQYQHEVQAALAEEQAALASA